MILNDSEDASLGLVVKIAENGVMQDEAHLMAVYPALFLNEFI